MKPRRMDMLTSEFGEMSSSACAWGLFVLSTWEGAMLLYVRYGICKSFLWKIVRPAICVPENE